MNEEKLPTDLAGYQHIVSGPIKEGDIWVWRGKPQRFVAKEYFGFDVQMLNNTEKLVLDDECGLYRKMPVAKQGDCDNTGWKAIRNSQTANDMGTKALTYDDNKPPLAYLPWAGIDAVAMVQAYGQKKYGDTFNYRKGMEVGRNLSCAIRHIRAYMEGEDKDIESGQPHLAHAACRILFTLQNIHDKTALDDRYQSNKQTQ
jgi:hypothetical protein